MGTVVHFVGRGGAVTRALIEIRAALLEFLNKAQKRQQPDFNLPRRAAESTGGMRRRQKFEQTRERSEKAIRDKADFEWEGHSRRRPCGP